MPFQALPIAFATNTGDPLSKLLWVYIVNESTVEDAPNGRGYLSLNHREAEDFCQASWDQLKLSLAHLLRLGKLTAIHPGMDYPDEETMVDLNLPMSQVFEHERKRIKASPDQVVELARRSGYRCAACGVRDLEMDGWHVDHIIPRSIGGADVEENLQLLCQPCNSRKGAKVHWVDFLGGRR